MFFLIWNSPHASSWLHWPAPPSGRSHENGHFSYQLCTGNTSNFYLYMVYSTSKIRILNWMIEHTKFIQYTVLQCACIHTCIYIYILINYCNELLWYKEYNLKKCLIAYCVHYVYIYIYIYIVFFNIYNRYTSNIYICINKMIKMIYIYIYIYNIQWTPGISGNPIDHFLVDLTEKDITVAHHQTTMSFG